MRTSLERYFVLFHYLISLWSCQFDGHLLHFLFPIAKLWQGRWQGNEIVVKVLKVRDWTTRKSRDFNEEYPKLRLLLNLDFSSASVFFSCCGHSFVCLHCVKPDLVYYFFLLHFTQFVCSRQILCGLSLFVCLSVPPSLSPTLPSLPASLGLHPRIFSHPNVLPMLGACQSPPAPHPIIITHWMPYGSLYNVLHEGTSEYFYSGHKVRTCHQVWWSAGICD